MGNSDKHENSKRQATLAIYDLDKGEKEVNGVLDFRDENG